MAELSCRKRDFAAALQQINNSLSTNALNAKALNVKAAILRKLGSTKAARKLASDVLDIDPLNFFSGNELYLAHKDLGLEKRARKLLADLERKMRGEVESCLELAVDYGNCGFWGEAIEVLLRPVQNKTTFASTYPMAFYYLAYFHQQKGDNSDASTYFSRASKKPTNYCFPFRTESIEVLNAAIEHDSSDALAHYYLGNLLYDLQPEEAIRLWERSRRLDDSFATVHRNLGWGYYRSEQNVSKAIASYEKAVACDSRDARLYAELDRLYETGNASLARRLTLFEDNHKTAAKRNDSFLREIMLLVLAGRYDEAIGFLANNHFHVREGGGGIHDVYVDAHLLRGLQYLKDGKLDEALKDFHAASEYPENLSVGRPGNDRRAPQVAYWIGTAYKRLGNAAKANEFYKRAANQKGMESWPEARFHQALSFAGLGRNNAADKIYDELIETGKQKLADDGRVDVFAKFGEGQTPAARKASAHYALGLGYLGKGQRDKAKAEFEKAVELNVSHVWARAQLSELSR
ncbi:MAG: tetratricopeptide repeat protein [Planctomycetota bacterium]